MGSWGPPPPPEPVQALAVACGEEKFAIAVWPRGLAMRFAKFITPRAGASACGGLCDSRKRGRLGWGGLTVNVTFNPLAKLHPVHYSEIEISRPFYCFCPLLSFLPLFCIHHVWPVLSNPIFLADALWSSLSKQSFWPSFLVRSFWPTLTS